ncbi:DODA-type extradiol aromatic ring-opening family dioxygenase [Rhodotorula paludigena]|uniref:DODA-type extradiol aromatic ring-opening family dioxygenase n=1 Tax=Rhodotorula paludigena TaxID=86838 RepID=UPI00317B0234
MMLGEDSTAGRYWEEVGREAIKRGVEGVVFMGAHWEVTGSGVEIASNPGKDAVVKQPVAWVTPDKYVDYEINSSPELAERVQTLLTDAGIEAKLNPKLEWIHDVFLVLNWMFPKRSPPVTVISTNAYYDPYLHTAIGAAVRPLRYQNVLIIGTGGTVHNLYRNAWDNIILYRDNFAQTRPPQQWALDFRNETVDAFTKNTGPALRRAAMRLMRHPLFRDAHGTDDHYAPVLFCAGAAGDQEDVGTKNTSPAEVWELEQMCNTQFQFGEWGALKA